MSPAELPDRVAAALASYEGPLLRYAQGLSGCRDTARDAVQDAFLKLWRCGAEGYPRAERAWLYAVTRNRVLEILRKERRMSPTDPGQLPASAATPAADPFEQPERQMLLRRLVDGLAPRDRELIRLKYQDGLSYQEISDITGLSLSHVGVILHKAVKSLRREAQQAQGGLA